MNKKLQKYNCMMQKKKKQGVGENTHDTVNMCFKNARPLFLQSLKG